LQAPATNEMVYDMETGELRPKDKGLDNIKESDEDE
jgi:hypothetical protein